MAKIQGLGSSTFEVELFDGKKNFNLWQSTVKDILVQQGLVKALNEKEKKPDNMTDEEWEEMEMKAVSTIRLCLAPELSSIGVKVEEEDKALLLLSSLPHSYEDLIVTLLVGKETLELDDVIAVLLENEKFKKPSVQSGGARFVARSDRRANRGRSVSRGNNSDRENSRSKGKESLGDSEPEVSNGLQDPTPKRCTHCLAEKTPQWRPGPLGPKTLCNACGMRFKTGKLLPEYRPANSPTFVSDLHSNSHKKVMEMRMAPQSSIPSEQ